MQWILFLNTFRGYFLVLFLVSLLPAGEGSEVNEAYIKKMVDWPGGLLGLSAAAAGLRSATWMTKLLSPLFEFLKMLANFRDCWDERFSSFL